MILIISENDQIIGADETILENKSLEEFKDNFPSMSIFLLQSENNRFEFEFQNQTYKIDKYPIIMSNQNANLYVFNDNNINTLNNSISNETNKDSKEKENNNETPELSLNLDIDSNDVEIKEEDKTNDIPELSLNLGMDSNNDEIKEEIQTESPELSLDLGMDSNDVEIKEEIQTESPELALDLGMDSNDNNEVILDIGLNNNKQNISNLESNNTLSENTQANDNSIKSISKEEIDKDLAQASKDLGIDDETLQQFFLDFKQQLIDEKESFIDAIKESDYELIHKSAHKLKGVALNLRLNTFGNLLKEIDELAKNKSDITKISNIINNIYDIIEENSNHDLIQKINLDFDMPNEDKIIVLKALLKFLENIKSKDNIKEELANAYKIIPITDLSNIKNLSDKELDEFVENLKINIQKEIK